MTENEVANSALSRAEGLARERGYLENIVGQRVNFLLLFCALVVTGALSGATGPTVPLTLTLGTIVAGLLLPPIWRAQLVLDAVIWELSRCDPNHLLVHEPRLVTAFVEALRNGKGTKVASAGAAQETPPPSAGAAQETPPPSAGAAVQSQIQRLAARPPFLWLASKSRRGLIGYYVPLAAVLFLGVLAVFEWVQLSNGAWPCPPAK